MQLVSFSKSEKIVKEKNKIFEYNLKDKDINFCFCFIKGRYPLSGFALNENCKELAYVVSGKGKIFVEDKCYNLKKGDVVLINNGEKFYWEGNLKLAMPCSPAWNSKQYKIINN